MRALLVATLLVPSAALVVASHASAQDSYVERIAIELNEGRKCEKPKGRRLECNYSFRGIRLTLVIDIREPQYSVFSVRSGPTGDGTYLKFGGAHSCATITQYGKAGEIANVFISPRTGDIFTRWDVPECAK